MMKIDDPNCAFGINYNNDALNLGFPVRRSIRKYSSCDLRVFKYYFKIPYNTVTYLKELRILRKYIKKRGCRAGKKKKEMNKYFDAGGSCYIGRIDKPIKKIYDNKCTKSSVNWSNLISVDRQVLKYCYPKILFANCRSIRNKFDEIQAIVFSKTPDIVIFVETWLEQCDSDSFEIDGYRAMHCIRNRGDKDHGGGVSLYLIDKLSIISVKFPDIKEIEILTVLFRSNNMQRNIPFIAVIAVYSPPLNIYSDNNIEYIESEIDRIKSINIDADILVIGDFNDLEIDKRLKKPFFSQLIKQQTHGINLIDKCFYSGKIDFNVSVTAPVASSDHKMVELIPHNYIKKIDNTICFQSRPRRNSCYRNMGNALLNTQWDDMINLDDFDSAVDLFHSYIVNCYEDCFPIVETKKKSNSKSWFNWQIERAIVQRNSHYIRNEIEQYIVVNKSVKELIIAAKKREYVKFTSLIENKSINFYQMINRYTSTCKKNLNPSFPCLDEAGSIDLMVSFYGNILNQHSPIDNKELPTYLPGMKIRPMSEAFVYNQLRSVKASVTSAPDGIPNFLLREYALELSGPITILLNRSLLLGYCPKIWKKNYLIAIPKKKVVQSPSDLRPIVLSSSLVKILEKHISNVLLSVIYNKIDNRQFGGLPGRSADHYLTFYLDFVNKNLDRMGNRVTAIITDYNKAFDAVDHCLFMEKLLKLDAPPMLCRWIYSFLEERMLLFKWNNSYTGKIISCSNGAPQGSVLGGIIFSITINEMASSWESRLKFVDDLTVLCVQPDTENGCLPQRIVDSLYSDSLESKMTLNASKCQFMVHCFSKNPCNFELKIGNKELTRVDQCKIIGVIVQADLKWDSHIESIIAKSNTKMYLLYRLRNVGMCSALLTRVYLTYIRPSLEYCCVIWTNSITKSQVRDLERVQKRVVKVILGCEYESYNNSLLLIGLDTLENRRNHLFEKYATKFLSTYPEFRPNTHFEQSGRSTRAAKKLCLPKCRTQRYKISPIPKILEVFNSGV